MALPTSYLASSKNLPDILDQAKKGRVPPKFTYEYLKQLGFPSSNDRPVIPLLKSLGFLDASGIPTERYRRFKDESSSKRVMAEGLREAYSDVFAIDEKADQLPPDKVKGIFARLSDKGDAVTEKMAKTFRALVEHADFSALGSQDDSGGDQNPPEPPVDEGRHDRIPLNLRHDVHVHLPASDDIKVYDAIFRSLRENLLS